MRCIDSQTHSLTSLHSGASEADMMSCLACNDLQVIPVCRAREARKTAEAEAEAEPNVGLGGAARQSGNLCPIPRYRHTWGTCAKTLTFYSS